MSIADQLIKAGKELSQKVDALKFAEPTTHIYNPLSYAWNAHEAYIRKWGNSPKKILFMGMNPGPFGMAQTGIPFGEIEHVRDWIGVSSPVNKPKKEHPKRLIEGFDCLRSEVSGRRLWGFFKEQFSSPEIFFKSHYVLNYCPLVFMETSGKNRTPDKLPIKESNALYDLCDEHLLSVVNILQIEWVIGVGVFAEDRAKFALKELPSLKFGRILHPSPASPAANKGWGEKALIQLNDLGVW
ncbi:MAG: single-stranded DNA-binding protein [Opitutae bacterium]|nr:single-stranded DNA-binding protein [Opitutae bacterium]